MVTIEVSELRANFKSFLARVKAGERIIITRHGEVLACLIGQADLAVLALFPQLSNGSSKDEAVVVAAGNANEPPTS